ncbi:hypothetical protein CSA56_18665 [candidate division KSB3 bacterium]|uniref:Response regulatory domain-containing protein n=1 Tax=candidate division KSB3 bacterium TaxID=2044937 RepID=A0A2G6K6H5_9BACT|nr:MAG: hypothetical protein CSA56_18665 [candidate division KSB3 bacterium]
MKQTRTILIAEEEKNTRETLRFVLKNAGYRVIHSLSGQEALTTILERQDSEYPIDLLIVDSDISGLTGWRVIEELERFGLALPIILITGVLDEYTLRKISGALPLAYLNRPFEPDEALACVSSALFPEEPDQEHAEPVAHTCDVRLASPEKLTDQDWEQLPVTFSTRRTSMNLADLLHEDCIQANITASDKRTVIRTIAQLAHRHPLLAEKSVEEIEQGLLDREETGSTGFGDGIAIPHCALDELSDFVLGILTRPDGIDFDSIDGQPTKLFVFIIAPASRRNEHIRILSAISSVLRSPVNVREILEADNPAVIRTSFLRHTHVEIDEKQKGFNLFTVTVQRQDAFEDILSLFAEIPDCYISVLEANNAGRYLYALPLFANFWNAEKKGFQRTIQATVKKPRANETLRKLNMLLEDSNITDGVLVLLQDVLYLNGTIDL